MTTIDNNNYELWLLRYAEGDLNAEERAAVDTWMESHPEAAEELALYREAPKLEKDERVRYGGEPQRKTAPLWPRMLRCGAAAAVVMVLMTPAMRMGTMDRMEGATAVAENRTSDRLQPRVEKVETSMPVRPKERATMADAIASAEETEATVATDTSEEPVATAPIETDMLIAIEDDPGQVATVESWSLIVYDNSADWGDLLRAANDAYQESLNEHPLGRLVSRTLPDSRQLEERVVEPLRQRIENLKNKR